MLNRSIIQGRLTADPDLRSTASGVSVLRFTLASDSDYKTADGQRHTNFINCTAWRKTAEIIDQYFEKGRMIVVEGELTSRKYTDKDGNNRTAIEISVDRFHFCDSKKDGQASQVTENDVPPSLEEAGFVEIEDEDFPF